MASHTKGKCKYCHLPGHIIDKCPTIICKHCKGVGHPNWLCPGNPNAEVGLSSSPSPSPSSHSHPQSPGLRNKNSMYGFESTNSLKGSNTQLDQVVMRKNSYGDFKSEFKGKHVQQVQEEKRIERVEVEKIKEEEEIKKTVINVLYYQKILQAKWGDLV